VVVYDATGKETSRTAVKIPAAAIAAADSPADPAHVTPAVQTDSQRFSFVGGSVLAVSTPTIKAVPPATSFASTTTSSSAPSSGLLGGITAPKTADIVDLHVDWVASGARGLPATIDSTVLLPTNQGLLTFDASTGPSSLRTDRTIRVARGGYTGRVDVAAVDKMIIETRGSSVVAMA
jgi:hypothetical protein